ncbi:MAG: transporter substrate-binding domain-containing protein [Magnetospirillum sp.]|nr:transporter substrate-binding domain-containing protein [Magnetospirillum sp.]
MVVGAHAAGEPPVFFGRHNLPPFEFLKEGEPKGADFDLARAIGRVPGRPVDISWPKAQARVQAGDGLPQFGHTPEREAEWEFNQPTLHRSFSYVSWGEAGGKAADASGKRVGGATSIVDQWPDARGYLFTENLMCMTYRAGSAVAAAMALLLTTLIVLAIQRNALTREMAWRCRIQGELELAKAQAESANRAKTTFLAAASHDLRQPFQALRLFLDILSAHVPATGVGRIALGHALNAYDGAERLLNALMEISRLEAGVVIPAVETVALAPLLTELAEECRPVAVAKRLSLRLRGLEVVVLSDPVLLMRVLRNLMVNAIRYTETGGILLACRRRGDRVVVEVWDTGRGIPADQLDNIFEDFYQLDHPDRAEVKGVGLGLAIVVKTARLLGHRIGVRSRLGRGSVFSVEVRIAGTPLRDDRGV